MPSPSICLDCELEHEEILQDAGAPRAGLSARAIDRLRQKLRVSSSSLEVLRRAGLSPERDELRVAEVRLIDALTDAALIAQRDLLVEAQLRAHGNREHLAAQVSRDFHAAAHWAGIFEFAQAEIPGTPDQWQLIRAGLTQAAKVIDKEPEKLSKLADHSRKRGHKIGLEIVRDFKRSIAEALKRYFRRFDSPRVAELFKLVYEDALRKRLSDPRRELNRIKQQSNAT
jgi:hypothetical protein